MSIHEIFVQTGCCIYTGCDSDGDGIISIATWAPPLGDIMGISGDLKQSPIALFGIWCFLKPELASLIVWTYFFSPSVCSLRHQIVESDLVTFLQIQPHNRQHTSLKPLATSGSVAELKVMIHYWDVMEISGSIVESGFFRACFG